MTPADRAHFHTFGFVVLRGAFDPGPLSAELDRALRDGVSVRFDVAGGAIGARYVPMMAEAHTPVSLSLLDQLAAPAAALLGAPVLPSRAKGVLYHGAAGWHVDSAQDVASVGLAAYLEPLDASNGALRVVPGSHRPELGAAVARFLADHPDATLPGLPIPTEPGDIIAFDEHLYHASWGGRDRRQWRIDYVADPVDRTDVTEAALRAWYEGQYAPDWDGGYDVDRYPSYGEVWRASGRPCLARLEALGAHAAAAAEEAYARSRRQP
ncbi:MAG: phytanoyl-CoA dioxygenase family protein [Myxococcota bacterium]